MKPLKDMMHLMHYMLKELKAKTKTPWNLQEAFKKNTYGKIMFSMGRRWISHNIAIFGFSWTSGVSLKVDDLTTEPKLRSHTYTKNPCRQGKYCYYKSMMLRAPAAFIQLANIHSVAADGLSCSCSQIAKNTSLAWTSWAMKAWEECQMLRSDGVEKTRRWRGQVEQRGRGTRQSRGRHRTRVGNASAGAVHRHLSFYRHFQSRVALAGWPWTSSLWTPSSSRQPSVCSLSETGFSCFCNHPPLRVIHLSHLADFLADFWKLLNCT